ncbi:MAG: site-specific DNA-methyltransferase [Desulfobacteraceae bacterium]|nr:MAG: site-specific DNA-methyltransferase [Desulfobacteraceae bacterium]
MTCFDDASIDLVVTSPPYPMIEMWDKSFGRQDHRIAEYLEENNGPAAFEAMHQVLDPVWKELYRVLRPGGFACINIGDATRTVDGHFRLYTNHARILYAAQQAGFSSLPCILWQKPTNAPNKFMGSGMLPAGAYVTLEHEYILILRKGNKRAFKTPEQRQVRQESALFWEERNQWFSDIWRDVSGITQNLKNNPARNRSGAFPFELAYRLINMYSVRGDRVLDPFSGTGTTMAAAMLSCRNSMGFEIDPGMTDMILDRRHGIVDIGRMIHQNRLQSHLAFIQERIRTKGLPKYRNIHYGFPVITNQEKHLLLHDPVKVVHQGGMELTVEYSTKPDPEFVSDWPGDATDNASIPGRQSPFKKIRSSGKNAQGELF